MTYFESQLRAQLQDTVNESTGNPDLAAVFAATAYVEQDRTSVVDLSSVDRQGGGIFRSYPVLVAAAVLVAAGGLVLALGPGRNSDDTKVGETAVAGLPFDGGEPAEIEIGSSTFTMSGPAIVRLEEPESLEEFEGVLQALVRGKLELVNGCLLLDAGVRNAVIWPVGTMWIADQEAVQLSDGTLIHVGDTLRGSGGGRPIETVDDPLGPIAKSLQDCDPSVTTVVAIHF